LCLFCPLLGPTDSRMYFCGLPPSWTHAGGRTFSAPNYCNALGRQTPRGFRGRSLFCVRSASHPSPVEVFRGDFFFYLILTPFSLSQLLIPWGSSLQPLSRLLFFGRIEPPANFPPCCFFISFSFRIGFLPPLPRGLVLSTCLPPFSQRNRLESRNLASLFLPDFSCVLPPCE